MLDKIKAHIVECQNRSGNMCGTSIVSIQNYFGMNYDEVKVYLKELYENKCISVRSGVNGKLIFLNIPLNSC